MLIGTCVRACEHSAGDHTTLTNVFLPWSRQMQQRPQWFRSAKAVLRARSPNKRPDAICAKGHVQEDVSLQGCTVVRKANTVLVALGLLGYPTITRWETLGRCSFGGKGWCSLLTGSRCRSLYVQGLANVDVDGVALDPPPIFRAQSRQGRLPHIRGNH